MNEEYLIAKLIDICNLEYSTAQSIVIDLSKRNLLEHLYLNICNIEDKIDLYNYYYRNSNNNIEIKGD